MDGVVILSTSQVVNDIWSIIGGFITAGLIILGTILFSSLHNNDHIFLRHGIDLRKHMK